MVTHNCCNIRKRTIAAATHLLECALNVTDGQQTVPATDCLPLGMYNCNARPHECFVSWCSQTGLRLSFVSMRNGAKHICFQSWIDVPCSCLIWLSFDMQNCKIFQCSASLREGMVLTSHWGKVICLYLFSITAWRNNTSSREGRSLLGCCESKESDRG